MPPNAHPVNTMWVYALKSDHLGHVIRFKAPAELGLDVYGGDVNTAYLNAALAIRQYLRSINGYPCEVDGHVYVVLKALYGLRQSGREWNSELNHWFLGHGYQRSLTEPCLYYLIEQETVVYYLGIEVTQTKGNITLSQGKYTREILKRFGYEQAHPVGNPMETNMRFAPRDVSETSDTSFKYHEAIGMLMYLATSTRSDLAFPLWQLSRFVANPSTKNVGALKSVSRYVAGTQDYGITYSRLHQSNSEVVVDGFGDSDWANDPDQRKSTTGFVFLVAGGAISWMSRRQSRIALSTAEAEYVALCEATMEAVATSNILQEILPNHAIKLRIGIDSQAAYVMATNPTYSRRKRHVELRWYFVREHVQKGIIKLHKVRGDENPADAFTKALEKKHLKRLLEFVGITNGK
ncbi:Hypothetical protein PHPALM_8623 [Phytophthora palmivora]|uniref:Reverse transcriptase Ty1/copia-type domain-containing protein n=1 Tax=Phytophthora palmivora TaxID=4796 RepID=A0A2P4Y9D6_9STRA|nr:Hypothetical protein PHPALM_8623 [Phytophthora palmivora]